MEADFKIHSVHESCCTGRALLLVQWIYANSEHINSVSLKICIYFPFRLYIIIFPSFLIAFGTSLFCFFLLLHVSSIFSSVNNVSRVIAIISLNERTLILPFINASHVRYWEKCDISDVVSSCLWYTLFYFYMPF